MDPIAGFHFSVDLGGKVKGYFMECGGLGSENELIPHKVLADNKEQVVIQIPGRLKWEALTLKKGITDNMDMWQWRKKVEDGDYDDARTNGSIVMYNSKGEAVAQWEFENAWPSKATGPQPKSDSNEIAIEELTIVHEGIRRVK